MEGKNLWLWLEIFCVHCILQGSTLMCYVCGHNGVEGPGECPTQFQYDCDSFAAAKGFSEEMKLFCRTMRHKTANDTFSVFKECTTEEDHRRIFADGKLRGCDTLFDSTGSEVTYCMCDWNMCNNRPLHEQLHSLQAPLPPRFISAPRLPQGNVSVGANVRLGNPPEPLAENPPEPSAENPPKPLADNILVHTQPLEDPILPVLEQYSEHEASLADPDVVDLLTDEPIVATTAQWSEDLLLPQAGVEADDIHLGLQATASRVEGLVCMVCGEGNLSEEEPECRKQKAMDCATHYPLGIETYCFSRDTKLSNGLHAIEKLCLSAEALLQEYGDAGIMEGCASSWQGRVNYCVCNTSKCNEEPIGTQMALNPPESMLKQSATVMGGSVKGAKNCFVCGEQNLTVPTDCSQMYEYNCNTQYPNGTEVLCLTRQTVLSTGLYAIEKRCISKEEHAQQYPDEDVIMKGCGSAWNNYVEYCVCGQDYCNHKNLTVQKLMHSIEKAEVMETGVTEVSVVPEPIHYDPETTEIPENANSDGSSFDFSDIDATNHVINRVNHVVGPEPELSQSEAEPEPASEREAEFTDYVTGESVGATDFMDNEVVDFHEHGDLDPKINAQRIGARAENAAPEDFFNKSNAINSSILLSTLIVLISVTFVYSMF